MLRIPPTVTQTPSLFQKFIARDSLSSWPEARALQNENAKAIAIWFFGGCDMQWQLEEVVLLPTACIMGLIRITIKRGTVEATWLVKPPSGILSTADLIGLRAKALAKHAQHVMEMRQKVSKNKLDTVLRYQREHKATIPGRLVLMRNTRVEDSLDSKMEPRYLGPLVVIRRTKGGSYVLAELDGSIVGGTVAQFRVIPYHANSVELPKKIHDLIDVSPQTLKELVDSDESVPTEYHYRTLGKKLYGVDRVRLQQSDTSGLTATIQLQKQRDTLSLMIMIAIVMKTTESPSLVDSGAQKLRSETVKNTVFAGNDGVS
ncbi:uncharacterized protein ARMOST_21651 [Armillaria ostoyae]|uniref:Uncharacterized protein n=1 Tax=Armillaria ostoyae TaxID=47428 RepID=A0A284SAT3_ARMOS|nr:uncharacterized protein ARMOST_21651 [Armillaria ostoyae]